MKKAVLIVVAAAILLTVPQISFSDCLTFGKEWRPLSWHILDDQSILFYDGQTPIAIVRIQNCTLRPSSTVYLTKRYLCDSDKIVIDNVPCNIMTITSASSGSF